MTNKLNSPGRQRNAAQPLGDRDGLVTDEARDKTAAEERTSAGPDGPDARDTAPKPEAD